MDMGWFGYAHHMDRAPKVGALGDAGAIVEKYI